MGGTVLSASDYFFASGSALDSGSTISTGIKLPKGALVLYSAVTPIDSDSDGVDAMTNAVTISIGTTTTADLFGTSAALNSAAVAWVLPKPDGTTYSAPLTPLAADMDILLTTGGAALTATEGAQVTIFYTIA